jgi:hypothetical protein
MKDVPYAIIENAHTYDKKVLDEFNKSTGGNKAISLGWQNQKVAESVLKNTGIPSMVSPNPEVPTKDGGEDGGYHFANAKKIKENAHGGTMQTSGEPVIMVDRLSGRTLGSVSKGEKVSFDETGKLTVIPGHRTDPNAITDNSRKLADAARHASTMAQDEYNVEGTASMVPTQQYQPQYQVGHQNINPEAPFAPSFGRHMARSSDITKSENHFSTAGMTDRTTSV